MKISRIVNFFAGLAVGLAMMTPVQAIQYTARHTFDIGNVQGDFVGSTFGGTTTSDGTIPADTTILCEAPGSTVNNCPPEISPMTDTKLYGQQNPITLYPIDSEFGYNIIDFLGAAQKTRDNDYQEGFIGDVPPAYFPDRAVIDGVEILFNEAVTGKYPPILGGVAISNAATDTYKVKPPMGTWCRGLGGLSVKCETEHYSVMEHILSCHELIPYFFADPVTGIQAVLNPGSTEIPSLAEYDCANAGLDDIALIMVGGVLGPQLIDGTPCDAVNDPVGCQIFPNDKTDVNNNVALTDDYSVQLKDDGKALYGWGTIHKRPNDVRMYASIPLPAEWKTGTNYIINSAKLVVRHHITNNPNDQLRPEDLENEAAIGRKPSHTIEGTIGGADEVWKSTKACFEGDGDLIDDEFGVIDPDFLGIGTVFKNAFFAITTSPPTSNVPTNDPELPYPLSSDLTGGFTNAWYTTVDRAPFEWSYDMNPDPTIQDYQGSWIEDDGTLTGAGGVLVSGPRWRLRPNKFGQDLPGLEVVIEPALGQGTDGADCYAPPFTSDKIKYPVTEPTITEINLLDWEDASTSPLAFSRGWIDVTQNGSVTVAGTSGGVPYTTNGLPMSDDFDLAVYIKGDRKPTAVYDAYLEIDYDIAPLILDVADVVGLTEAAALAALDPQLVPAVTYASSDTVAAGLVISQVPAACQACASVGDTVDLVVSTGPAAGTLDVANVVGMTEAAALAALDPQLVAVVNYVNDPAPAGEVIAQVPAACVACATAGDTVTLTVSNGPVVIASDVTVASVSVPSAVFQGVTRTVSVTIVNAATASGDGTGTVTVTGTDGTSQVFTFTNLIPGATRTFSFPWTSPTNPTSGTVVWTFDVTVGGVIVDTATASTKIRGFSG